MIQLLPFYGRSGGLMANMATRPIFYAFNFGALVFLKGKIYCEDTCIVVFVMVVGF